jgi:hypothetical protein
MKILLKFKKNIYINKNINKKENKVLFEFELNQKR